MSIELKQAAQQVIDAWDACGRYPDSTSDLERLDAAITSLRTAIQPAEAKTDEPVAWGWAIVDNKGLERRTRARIQDFFGSNQEAKPFSLEDIAREDREFAPNPNRENPYANSHPAPGVPDDSKRLDYLQDRGATIDLIPGVAGFYPMRFRVGGLHSSANIDVRAAIDAAMLAAKDASA